MKLPTPRTVTGWLVSLVLIVISFLLYYGFTFKILSSFYYTSEYKVANTPSNFSEKIQVDIFVPQNLSRFEARELLVSVKSKSEITDNVLIRIDETQDLVFFCSDASSRSTDCTEDNILNFGKFAENQKKTRGVWVIVAPRTDIETPVPSGVKNEDIKNEDVKRVSYTVFYKYVTEFPSATLAFTSTPALTSTLSPAPVLTSTPTLTSTPSPTPVLTSTPTSTPTPTKEPPTWQRLDFGAGSSDVLQSTLDSSRAFLMSTLFTILLPPWANGILPALVLFIVYSLEHKIQPGQRLKQQWEQRFHLKDSESYIFLVAIFCLLLPFIVVYLVFLWIDKVNVWPALAIMVIFSFISWAVLHFFFESTDLQDGDPIYRAKPKESGIQQITLSSTERNSLVQIAHAVKNLSRTEAQIASTRSAAKEEGTEMVARVGDLRRSISHKRQSSRVFGMSLPVRRMVNILQKVEDSLQQTNAILMKQNASAEDTAPLASLDILAFLKPEAILENENLAEHLATRLKTASRKRVDELLALNPLTLFNLMALMLVQKNPRLPLSDSDLLEALKDHPDWLKASQFHHLEQLFPYLLEADFYAAENLLGIRLPSLNPDIFNPQTPETALVTLTEYLKMKSRRQEQTSLPVAVFDYLASIPDEKIGKIKKYFKTSDFGKTLFEKILEGIHIPPAKFQAYRFLMKVGCYLPDDLLERIKTEAKSDDLASLSSELRPFIERCQDEISDVKALQEYLCTKNK